MNKSVIHIVLVVLAVLAGGYGAIQGVVLHNLAVGEFYAVLGILFGGATKVL